MHNLKLEFSVSDVSLALIKQYGAGELRDEVLRHIFELGLCELLDATTRTHRDHTNYILAGKTKDYKSARNALFSVDEPKPVPVKGFASVREVTG